MKIEDISELKKQLEQSAETVNLRGETPKSPEQKEAEKEINEWKEEKKDYEILDEFKTAHDILKVILTTDQYNGLIFYGEGGIGKTVLTLNSIKSELKPDEWEYSNGYTTPLSLCEMLFNNRNKKVIILDDVEGIFNNPTSMSILKGALWDSDGKRIIQYNSTSDKAIIPPKFIMNAKIIVLCNHIANENDSSTRAMISRTIPYKVEFSFKEKMNICEKFIDKDDKLTDEEKDFIKTVLKYNVNEATKDFNFRTLKKLIAFTKYNKSKAGDLFRATTEQNEDIEAFLEAVKQTNRVNEQIKIFQSLTGKQRGTFFNIKKRLKKENK